MQYPLLPAPPRTSGSVVCSKTALHPVQRKGVKEMEPVLALPLVSSACLAFLRRHLPLSTQQQQLIDESLATTAQRLASLTAALSSAAACKVFSCSLALPIYIRAVRCA